MRRQKKAASAVCWSLGIFLAAVFGMTGCRRSDSGQDGQKEAVEIPVIFQVDPASSYKSNEELVEAFNGNMRADTGSRCSGCSIPPAHTVPRSSF